MPGDSVVNGVLVSVGVIAIVVAIIWRTGSRRRQINRSTRLLASTDPQRRVDAARTLTELGLDRSARVLLTHVRTEADPDVRVAIAAAVARRQWEPGGPPAVTPLREWAAAELTAHGYNVTTFGPATTRLADMGGPRLPPRVGSAAGAEPDNAPLVAPPATVPTETAAGGAQ